MALAPALLFFRRISSLLSILNLFSRSSFGSKFKPKINTKYLQIEIVLQSRQATIHIIEGVFKGRSFSSLSQNEVSKLLEELKTNDPRGFNILNVIISQNKQSTSSSDKSQMTEEEALSVLGLKKGASDDDIKKSKVDYGMVVSETQSNGKGQRGRKWISYKGNLFVSFFYNLKNINFSISKMTKFNCLLVKKVISK